MIEVRVVAKYFGRFSALRDLNLAVRKGEFVAVFGRNGAGKTTLLRILAGLSRPSSGTVTIHEQSPRSPQEARGLMGYLSHNTALYGDLTALENLRFFARLFDLADDEASLVARIRQVGLGGRESEPIRTYSRGMQQRLAIARAFLHDPPILLLDEPFTGLDQIGTEFLKRYLLDARSRGNTCIMAIHDTALGYDLADRLVVIDKGVVALEVTRAAVSLDEFQRRYRNMVTA
jgi:heme exporter protein A